MTLEEKLRAMHFRVYGSATDEVWNRDGYCSEDGHYWPCDTILLLGATEPSPIDRAAIVNHPLRDVSQDILDVARSVMREVAVWKDVESDLADPIADSVVSALHLAGYIRIDRTDGG